MMAALILSTAALSLRSIFFIPPSIIALCASTEVKRSSSSSTGVPGKLLRSCFRNSSTYRAASAGVLVQIHGIAHDKERYALSRCIIFEIFDYLCRRNCVQGGREHAQRVRDRQSYPLSAVVYSYDPVHPANVVNKYVRKK